MRTTIHLPDELIARAKQKAAERRSTLTAVIEEALREALARKPSRRGKASRTRLPNVSRQRTAPGCRPETTPPRSWIGWMLLIDVNVLVYAHREDADEHPTGASGSQPMVITHDFPGCVGAIP
jgi:hypothetical protein